MNLPLEELENRLQSLIENHLSNYLPGRRAEDRVAQQLAAAIKANLTTKELKKFAPSVYTLVVHPSQAEKWEKDARLFDGLIKILKLAASEAGIFFEGNPTITLATNDSVPLDDVQVMVSRQLEQVGETQGMPINGTEDEENIPRNSFLIVGGVKVFPLNQSVANIGRRLDNHLVIDDPRVSRYHAQIRTIKGRFVIFDLNSTGGIYVNGQRTNQTVLYPGDVISLAGLPIIFGQDNPPPGAKSGDTAPLSISSSERSTAILSRTGQFKKDKK
jgi:pSer/pThr/pTyr-binding forkhead associated (FHA) protein